MSETERKTQQDAVECIVKEHIDVLDSEWFSRDEAEDKLGYSWTNLMDIIPNANTPLCDIRDAVNELEDVGFTVSVDKEKIQVMTSYDAQVSLGLIDEEQ